MFKYSEHGIKNKEIFKRLYVDFIEYCKSKTNQGTFSTYMDGEPVFFSRGTEFSYRKYKKVLASKS